MTGKAYVVFGSGEPIPSNVELSSLDGTNGFELVGAAAGDLTGPVGAAGDVNGDGFDDIIIGAFGVEENAGRSYVVFGSDGGFSARLNLASLDGSNGFRLTSVDSEDESGYSVDGAGDFNGDGIDDLLIGAPRADANGLNAGQAFVVYGSTSGFGASVDLELLDGTDGFVVNGSASSGLGGDVAAAGDINGDGIDDVIVSAPDYDGFTGETFVLFGSPDGFPASSETGDIDGTNGFRLVGTDSTEFSGRSVDGIGDLNGDGIDDLLISGSFPNCGVGGAYVVFGSKEGFSASVDLSTLDGTNGFYLQGIDGCDSAGNSLSAAGDFNGDGFADIIIGADGASSYADDGVTAVYGGESYVVFGSGDGFAPTVPLASLDGLNGIRIEGIADGDSSGRSVSNAGDVNGDGLDDVIIGAFGADPNGEGSGQGYVLFGFNALTVSTLSDSGDDATVAGDLLAEAADGDGLSLREAVLLANSSP
ncbi:MAG: hypothetical protein AAFW76_12530, partial [Pseudomonadota bacterium]